MTRWFVDANVFLRFFTIDDKGQQEQSARLLRKAAAGEVELVCGPPILFEIAWTLRSAYKLPNDRVLAALRAIYALPGLTMTDSDLVGEALSLAAASGGEFADAYIAATVRSEACDGVATFNLKDFARLGTRTSVF